MAQSICAKTIREEWDEEPETVKDNLFITNNDSINATIIENKQMIVNENIDESDSLLILPITQESANNFKGDEEFLTDSEDYNFKPNTDIHIIVDETDLSSSDEEKNDSSKVSNVQGQGTGETLIKAHFGDITNEIPPVNEATNNVVSMEISASGSSLPSTNNLILCDDVIESSDNMETFINFSRKKTMSPLNKDDKEQIFELEEDADLFASQEEQWLKEKSIPKKENYDYNALRDMLMHYYKIKEEDIVKILNYRVQSQEDEEDFLGFSKNEFSCKIKLCPTKRQEDLKEYFNKCEKEIENMSQNKLGKQQNEKVNPVIKQKGDVKEYVDDSKKKDALKEIVNNKEKKGTKQLSDSEEDFLGFESVNVDCKHPKCVEMNKNSKKVLKKKRDKGNSREAKEVNFKKPNLKKPKVVAQNVFSLFD